MGMVEPGFQDRQGRVERRPAVDGARGAKMEEEEEKKNSVSKEMVNVPRREGQGPSKEQGRSQGQGGNWLVGSHLLWESRSLLATRERKRDKRV